MILYQTIKYAPPSNSPNSYNLMNQLIIKGLSVATWGEEKKYHHNFFNMGQDHKSAINYAHWILRIIHA